LTYRNKFQPIHQPTPDKHFIPHAQATTDPFLRQRRRRPSPWNQVGRMQRIEITRKSAHDREVFPYHDPTKTHPRSVASPRSPVPVDRIPAILLSGVLRVWTFGLTLLCFHCGFRSKDFFRSKARRRDSNNNTQFITTTTQTRHNTTQHTNNQTNPQTQRLALSPPRRHHPRSPCRCYNSCKVSEMEESLGSLLRGSGAKTEAKRK
jgi:hypothetical protein